MAEVDSLKPRETAASERVFRGPSRNSKEPGSPQETATLLLLPLRVLLPRRARSLLSTQLHFLSTNRVPSLVVPGSEHPPGHGFMRTLSPPLFAHGTRPLSPELSAFPVRKLLPRTLQF